jgi:hypothetical protein
VVLTPAELFLVGRAAVPPAVRVCLGAARSPDELERGLHALVTALTARGEATGAVV